MRHLPDLESRGSLEQAQRIAASIAQLGFEVETLEDILHEPVAVRVSSVLPESDIEPIVAAATACQRTPSEYIDPPEISDVLPYGLLSQKIYPPTMCEVLDAVVRGASSSADRCAVYLAGAERWQPAPGFAGYPHTDYPVSLDDPAVDKIHGINVHLTLRGSATARFAPLRSFAQVRQIAESMRQARAEGRTVAEINDTYPEVYAQTLDSATPPVLLTAGDIVIFQSRPHRTKGLLPTVHEFTNISDDRWHNVFTPRAGERRTTERRRSEFNNARQTASERKGDKSALLFDDTEKNN